MTPRAVCFARVGTRARMAGTMCLKNSHIPSAISCQSVSLYRIPQGVVCVSHSVLSSPLVLLLQLPRRCSELCLQTTARSNLHLLIRLL